MQIVLNEYEVLSAVKEYLQRRGFTVEDSRFRFSAEPEDAELVDRDVVSDVTLTETSVNQTE